MAKWELIEFYRGVFVVLCVAGAMVAAAVLASGVTP
jgi:hypothetical protein